jgi:outer membrane protein insertion porin family/translocation and assembly module TamA
MVAFADTSDVTRKTGDFRFNVPHLSVGPGMRYDTPVGPLRLDIGYRVPGMQKIGERDLPREEGSASELFGIDWLPVAIHLAFGEAF